MSAPSGDAEQYAEAILRYPAPLDRSKVETLSRGFMQCLGLVSRIAKGQCIPKCGHHKPGCEHQDARALLARLGGTNAR